MKLYFARWNFNISKLERIHMISTIELETDVLILGGGAAGARAALATREAGLDTVMVVKGLLGKSGCSPFAGNLTYFYPSEKGIIGDKKLSPEEQEEEDQAHFLRVMEFYGRYTHYLGDQEYLKDASEWFINKFYPWLEKRGFYMMRNEKGKIISDIPYQTQAWSTQMGMSGQLLMDLLRKHVMMTNVRLLEETSATRLLLTEDGEVAGAAALDYARGKFYIIRAKAVILATGHSNHLSLRSTGTRDGSASGWVMTYEAGGKLQDIEMQWYHASDVAYPATWMRLHMYPNPLPDTTHRNQLYNQEGEMFFDGNFFPYEPVPYILQLKYLAKEVKAGRAKFDGGYFSSYAHVEPEVLDKYMYQTQFAKKVGLDLKSEPFENAISWHMNVGGSYVDGKTMESGVPGLLIAGSVSALVTGGLPNVMYDGIVAAKTAGQLVKSTPTHKTLDAKQVSAEKSRVFGLFRTEPKDGLLPGQVKKRIRRAMWDHHGYIKTEETMQRALVELQRIEDEDLPKMRLKEDTPNFNYDWVDALDAIDMLQALKTEVKFCLHRKESRGAFYREDYPNTDNENWLIHLIGKKGEDGELEITTKPVDLPYVQPKEKFASFFDVDY
jgi:succinate dehydrogenase/fumarate reductase flavoprotein subunit